MGRKIEILTFIQMRYKHFSFFLPLFFMFDVVSLLFFSFLVWCPFFFCLSCFPQWLEVLKTLWMVCSVVIPNWDWGRKYDLWTSNPLIHCHQSWECRLWIYQACLLSSQGLPEPDTTDGALKHESSNRLLSFALVLKLISKSPHPNFL